MKPLLVLAALVAAGGVFGWRVGRLIRLFRALKGNARPVTGRFGARLAVLGREVLLHSRLLRNPVIGAAHLAIFTGFLAVQIHTSETLLDGLMPGGFTWATWAPRAYPVYRIVADALAALVLVGLAVALARRLFARPAVLSDHRDARLVLLFTALIIVSYFGMNHAVRPSVGRELWWWVHVAVILGFLVYLPGSKHLHILTAVPNLFLRWPGPSRPLTTPDLEGADADRPGLGSVRDLSWKQALDLISCTECGRCEAVCPASLTGKPLSPKRVVVDLREELRRQSGAILAGAEVPGFVREGTGITEEVLFACTSCRACEEACPVGIQHLDLILEARRCLVLLEGRFPAELQQTFKNLEEQSNPWGFPADTRADWAAGLEIPTIADRPGAEVLYFVGCAGSFDDRGRKTATAVARLLRRAGVDFAILGREESCTGDPARRAGNEYLAQGLLKATAETLNRVNPRTILTGCPHCLNTLKHEVPEFGARFTVVHHAEYLAGLVRAGKLVPRAVGPAVDAVIHDSCYLGRWNDQTASPRDLLAAIPGVTVHEPPRTARAGFCCGAGGGRMFMEEKTGTAVNRNRAAELAATGAGVVAVACPFCATMLGDGLKAEGSAAAVRDLALLLDEATA